MPSERAARLLALIEFERAYALATFGTTDKAVLPSEGLIAVTLASSHRARAQGESE